MYSNLKKIILLSDDLVCDRSLPTKNTCDLHAIMVYMVNCVADISNFSKNKTLQKMDDLISFVFK